MVLHTIFELFWSISILSVVSSALDINSTLCNRRCGGNLVQYPFGFSDGCEIRLNCSSSSSGIQIGGFHVLNVTSDQILVDIPAKCSRPIGDLDQLFGSSFAPTWRNGLLLENCTEPMNDCVVPRRLVMSRIGLEDCQMGIDHRITCYSVGSNDSAEFLDKEAVKGTGGCLFLLSSIMVNNSGQGSSIALDFQTVELGWWLDGGCPGGCDPNANCTEVRYGGSLGHRCKCKHGYVGDGFAGGGGGCRRG